MALDGPNPLITTTIRIAAAGLGAAVAGPLGFALGGILADALGRPAAQLVSSYAEKFGEEAAKKLLDTGTDSLVDKLKKFAPDLESVYRQTLRLSLAEIQSHADPEFEDWFANWDTCLKTSVQLNLEEIQPSQLTPNKLDELFRRTMERLDAQGAAIKQKSLSLDLNTRSAPNSLLAELSTRLPEGFKQNFRALIVQPEHEQAWKEAELAFQDSLSATIGQIDERTKVLPQVAADTAVTREDVAAIRAMLEGRYESAVKDRRIPEQELKAKDEEITRLAGELRKLQEQLAERSSEPAEARLSECLAAGDLDAALRLKTQQVEARREEATKLPRDLYELGTIHELRFEWPQALAAYRQAWELGKNPDYGFKYALLAGMLNHFNEAIAAQEALLTICTDPAPRANVLNNLAILYRATQGFEKAEKAHDEALAIYRKLAEANSDGYLPDVAMTLNNLANLYSSTQRIRKAEEKYAETLSIYRRLAEVNSDAYLPDVAMTLNNQSVLYRVTQRTKEAEQKNGEALSIHQFLAKTDPNAHLPNVAMTLNNLANLYSATQRIREAEEAYRGALSIRRNLAKVNPDAYLPEFSATLNNLALLLSNTHRVNEAERAFGEVLATFRKLAEANPEAYMPDIADTLNNLAILYRDSRRIQDAEDAYGEALSTYRKLAEVNPDAYMSGLAGTLNNIANLYKDTQRIQNAEPTYDEALAIYRKLAEANPDAYMPYVATTLNNLGFLHYLSGNNHEAEENASEAEGILEPFWQSNPQPHGNQMAKILWTHTLIREKNGPPAAACALVHRALAAAYDPALKQTLQQLIDRLCPASQR